ncbi:SH3 domain-containing protein [uncultured Roseobacter sp.]|uniref:SH3 domain-containing protein n=1 Tax=uncultured Roseobacter sp. TaxID=114847 RepID=UPI002630F140|nr:SH3 domain-containing protein [uncultured Roseobacter sp.]
MDRYRVTSDWKAAYPDPIVLSAPEELWLSGKSDTWDGYVWVWARNQRGKEGWIPDTLVQNRAGKTYANADFSAVELTCHRGEELLALSKTHGWILCRAQSGAEGWVPARNLSAI